MKKLVKLFSLALAILTFSSVAISCKSDETQSGGGGGGGGENQTQTVPEQVEDTTHEREDGNTSYKIMSNGETSYKLVLPETTDKYLISAAAEFNGFFEEATGKRLETVKDTDVTVFDATSKYISLGDTWMAEEAGVTVDKNELGSQGYEIVTKNQSVFIGGNSQGVLYGVYDVLEYFVGYEFYSVNYYRIEKNVTEIELPAFKVKEIPDFEYRIASYGVFQNAQARQRLRLMADNELYIKECVVHSAFTIVPPEDENTHDNWFAGEQLCYTAGSYGTEDESEYYAMVEYATQSCINFIKADPNRAHEFLSFTQRDHYHWCACSACSAVINKNNGAKTSTQIIFINDVSERVQKWLEGDEESQSKYGEVGDNLNRKITFVIFAYHMSEAAPSVKNKQTGEYELTSPEMQLNDNVAVMVAPIRGNYVDSVYAENNTGLYELFMSWEVVAPMYLVWGYDCYFRQYLTPYDSWGSMQDLAKLLYNLNTRVYWPQAAYNLPSNTNFDNLKQYVWSKLLWNVNVDMNALINEYFEAVYREAGDVMKDAYYQMRTRLYQQKFEGRQYDCMSDNASAKFYPKAYLLNLYATMESARAYLKKYELSDPEYYKTVMDEITLETISPRYLLLIAHSATYSTAELNAFRSAFIEDIKYLGVNKTNEGDSLNAIIDKLNALG